MGSDWISQIAERWEISVLLAQVLAKGFKILLIVLLCVFGLWALKILTATLTENIQKLDDREDSEFDQRAKTILRFVRSIGVVVILITAILTTLDELNLNITPLIASVGVAGLALGLGAQTLVKDAISGLFILMEDQFHVGDAVTVGGISGSVESLSLRTTHLRDLSGTLHIIPNGEIRIVSNHTFDWARALVEILVPFEQDVDEAFAVLQKVIAEVSINDAVAADLIEPVVVTGPEELSDKGVRFRILGKVLPGQQWQVQRAIRRSVHDAFVAEGIQLGLPRQELRVVSHPADAAARLAAQ